MKHLLLLLLLLFPACARFQDAFQEQARLRALRDKPSPRARAMAHHMTGVIHERQGRFDEALQETRAAARLAPDVESLQMRHIAASLRLQKFEEAHNVAQRVAAANPDNYMAWVWLGVIWQHRGDFDAAAQALRQAIDIDPDNVLGYEALAAVREETNDWIGAIDLYAHLLELAPQSPALHYQLGLSYVRIQQMERAEGHLRSAVALNPTFPHAHFLMGLVAFQQDNMEQAEAAFRRTLLLAPSDEHAAAHMGAVLARQGRHDGALLLFRLLGGLTDYNPAYLLYRDFAILASDQEIQEGDRPLDAELPYLAAMLEAAAHSQTGEDPGPVFETLRNIDGDLEGELEEQAGQLVHFFGEEEVSRALVDPLERLFETHGSDCPPPLRLGLARLLMVLERDEDAETVLQTLVDEGRAGKLGHYYLAVIYDVAEAVADAERHLEKALEYAPDDPDLMNYLGYLYAENNMKLDVAERLLKRALEMDPNNGFYLDSLGWVYYRQGRAEEAIAYIRRAILAMESDDAELRHHLGDAYYLDGQIDKALREWERAYRLDPEREELKEKLERYQSDPA